MSKLSAVTPFNEYNQEWTDLSLREISGLEIVSLAIANEKKLKEKTPIPGSFIDTPKGRLLWTGQNQYFLFSDVSDDRLDETLSDDYGDVVYCTLQTDGWAGLEIVGASVHDVLERFIPLDIRSADPGFGTRTSAQHMSVIVMKTDHQTYHLLTPRSSSAAFLEALEKVISHVLP